MFRGDACAKSKFEKENIVDMQTIALIEAIFHAVK